MIGNCPHFHILLGRELGALHIISGIPVSWVEPWQLGPSFELQVYQESEMSYSFNTFRHLSITPPAPSTNHTLDYVWDQLI